MIKSPTIKNTHALREKGFEQSSAWTGYTLCKCVNIAKVMGQAVTLQVGHKPDSAWMQIFVRWLGAKCSRTREMENKLKSAKLKCRKWNTNQGN